MSYGNGFNTEGARQLYNGIRAALEMEHGFDPNTVKRDENGNWSPVYGQTDEPVDIIPKTLWYSCMFGQNVSPGTEMLENEVPVKKTADGYTIIDDHTSTKCAK
ncbi:hypothetical protein GQ472_05235 [archaeon]|nr:hypothetical protein [archaeon]